MKSSKSSYVALLVESWMYRDISEVFSLYAADPHNLLWPTSTSKWNILIYQVGSGKNLWIANKSFNSFQNKMKKMYSKQTPTQHRRNRASSLGDVHLHTHARSPIRSPRPPPRVTERSMSISCANSPQKQPIRSGRKHSVISIGEHFTSLLNISTQVRVLHNNQTIQNHHVVAA